MKTKREEIIQDALELLHNTNSCGFILEQDADLLFLNRYDVDAKDGIAGISELELFLKYAILKNNEIMFLVIHNIDLTEEQEQSLFFTLVKDRCIYRQLDLLNDVVVVFTLSNIDGSKKVMCNLWNLGSNLIDV